MLQPVGRCLLWRQTSWLVCFVSQVELNEIESSCEEYPLTRSFCHLISTLVENSLPINLGAGLRVPGFQPYLDFLRDSVFLPFPTRAYRRPAEKVNCCIVLLPCLYKEKTCSCVHVCIYIWSLNNYTYPCLICFSCCLSFAISVGGCWCCPGGVPQAAAGLRAPALRLCARDGGATGRAGLGPQAPRTQHHVPPAQRLTHAGALPQPAGGGRTPAGHLCTLPWWENICFSALPRMRDCLCVCVCSDVVLCYSSPTGKKHLESAVLHCLRLLDLALQKEVVFMDLLRESQASLLVSPLEQLLQGVSPQTRKADHIVNIAR